MGSRARTESPADEWSDLDVVLVVDDPDQYLSNATWLGEIGEPRITFLESTAVGGGLERRVLFDGGLDVDFAVFSPEEFIRATDLPEIAEVGPKGVRVLFDRDGLIGERVRAVLAAPVDGTAIDVPSESDFSQAVADFWYHALWTARRLRRGELWIARSCCDTYMKRLLLQMIEWHAHADPTRPVDTWFGGRFLERWAEPWIVRDLRGAFAHYDAEHVRRGLMATTELYRRLANETAERIGIDYPQAQDDYASEMVAATLADEPGSSARRA